MEGLLPDQYHEGGVRAPRGTCFNVCLREQGARREVPGAQEFSTEAIEELQEALAMHGECHPTPPSVAAAPHMGSELCVRINITGLNRAASQDLFWLSRVGLSYQRLAHHAWAAHVARRQAVLTEEVLDPRKPPDLQSLPASGAGRLVRSDLRSVCI